MDLQRNPVEVPEEVLRGLEAVSRSGLVNMFDGPRVAELAEEFGYPDAAVWIEQHRESYARGIFQGFQHIPNMSTLTTRKIAARIPPTPRSHRPIGPAPRGASAESIFASPMYGYIGLWARRARKRPGRRK